MENPCMYGVQQLSVIAPPKIRGCYVKLQVPSDACKHGVESNQSAAEDSCTRAECNNEKKSFRVSSGK